MIPLNRRRIAVAFPAISGLAVAWLAAATPAQAGDVAAGKEKAAYCSACHGMDGLSPRPDAPHLAGQSEIYMRDQLQKYRSGERVHPEMNIVARDLSDQDIDDLTAWYSSIKITAEMPR